MLETDRLILRNVQDSDAEGLFALDADPEVHRYLGGTTHTSIEQSHQTIAHLQRQYKQNGIGRWAAIEKASGSFVGWAGLKLETGGVNGHDKYYDLGYRLLRAHWGKGFGKEAAIASRDYAFETLKLEVLNAAAHTGNVASNKILKGLGFEAVETFHFDELPCFWYELKQSEWRKRSMG